MSQSTKPTDILCDHALRDLAKGNSKALSRLYRSYGKMIYAVAYQIVQNTSDAEDVLQDVMVQIVRGANGYQAGSNPRAWVMAITRNRAIDYLRHRVTVEDIDLVSYRDSLLGSETERKDLFIKDALNTLNPDDALLIHLKLYVGLNHEEIAQILGITAAACRKRYERALDKLREYFQEN